MKMSAQDIWKHITHLITLWEDPWSPQNCSKIPKWKMRVVSAWVSRVHWRVEQNEFIVQTQFILPLTFQIFRFLPFPILFISEVLLSE